MARQGQGHAAGRGQRDHRQVPGAQAHAGQVHQPGGWGISCVACHTWERHRRARSRTCFVSCVCVHGEGYTHTLPLALNTPRSLKTTTQTEMHACSHAYFNSSLLRQTGVRLVRGLPHRADATAGPGGKSDPGDCFKKEEKKQTNERTNTNQPNNKQPHKLNNTSTTQQTDKQLNNTNRLQATEQSNNTNKTQTNRCAAWSR